MELEQSSIIIDKIIRALRDIKSEADRVPHLKSEHERLLTENRDLKNIKRQLDTAQFNIERLSTHTNTYFCPKCDGYGGFQTGPESGEACDFCTGTCFVNKDQFDSLTPINSLFSGAAKNYPFIL